MAWLLEGGCLRWWWRLKKLNNTNLSVFLEAIPSAYENCTTFAFVKLSLMKFQWFGRDAKNFLKKKKWTKLQNCGYFFPKKAG